MHEFRQIYSLALVFVGNFNPVIIQPFWLATKKLIREQEANSATVEVIHPELVRWRLDWLYVEVTHSRFEMRTSQEPYFEIMKDLALSIFDILKETPISAFGINHLLYFAFPNEERHYELGNKLVPLGPWESFIKNPRVAAVEIQEVPRADAFKGSFKVKLQPSDIPLNTKFALLIQINDHIDLYTDGKKNYDVLPVLSDVWTPSKERALGVCEQIWKI